jgi:hypothetical protein
MPALQQVRMDGQLGAGVLQQRQVLVDIVRH